MYWMISHEWKWKLWEMHIKNSLVLYDILKYFFSNITMYHPFEKIEFNLPHVRTLISTDFYQTRTYELN